MYAIRSYYVSKELQATVADHAAGNYRVLMNTCDELLAAAFDRQKAILDEKLFIEVFASAPRKSYNFV